MNRIRTPPLSGLSGILSSGGKKENIVVYTVPKTSVLDVTVS